MPKLSDILPYKALPIIKATKFGEIYKLLPPAITAPTETYYKELVDTETLVGIEVEVENIGDEAKFSGSNYSFFWTPKGDGSLRNSGMEFITYPLSGKQIVTALVTLFNELPQKAQFSHRTSIHIHTDVRGLTPEEVAKVFLVYLTLEPQLFSYIGEERERGIFCVPWFLTDTTEGMFKHIKDISPGRHVQAHEWRYTALNLAPITSFGTIEFRHLGGTRDISLVLAWLNMIFAMRKYALSKDLNELIKEIIDLNTNSQYRMYAQKILGDLFWKFSNFSSLDERLTMGVISVKRALFSDRFLTELREGGFAASPAYRIMAGFKPSPQPKLQAGPAIRVAQTGDTTHITRGEAVVGGELQPQAIDPFMRMEAGFRHNIWEENAQIINQPDGIRELLRQETVIRNTNPVARPARRVR